MANNRTVIDKIKETNEWLDSRLEQSDFIKQKDPKQEISNQSEESKDGTIVVKDSKGYIIHII